MATEVPPPVETRAKAAERRLKRIFFLSDLHSPFHDKHAFRLVEQVLAVFRPSIFVSIGDFIDCHAISRHSKNPARVMGLPKELELANGILDTIDKLCPKARRIYVEGNHETRLERFLQEKAPELYGLIDVPTLLRLKERGWEHVGYKDDIRIGKVYVTHDVGSAGRYNVFKTLDTYQASVVTGHTHRLAYVVEGDAAGGRKVSAQFGWLGDVNQVDWMHRVKARREWSTGFGYGYIDPATGFVYLVPVPIVKNSCVVEGRIYTA